MRHIIISDTHSNVCIEKAYRKSKKLVKKHPDIDTIVINGDLLGIFSMEKSTIHKERGVSEEDIKNYLQKAAPKFYNRFITDSSITTEMIVGYVKERYDWCIQVIKDFSKIRFTLFNMGNHESPHHFLVLEELSYLIGKSISPNEEEQHKIGEIFELFEKELKAMEKTHKFKYLRHEPHIYEKYLILGIPGESHSTAGNDPFSIKQEEKTKELIRKAEKLLPKAGSIIIYNHTQGNYEENTGNFKPSSPSLNRFMKNLPDNIFQKIFVQSHNHWAHTQHIKDKDFHYILNNAGLHDGIFNLISFNTLGVDCYDIDPGEEEFIKLNLALPSTDTIDGISLIRRNYPDEKIIIRRKKQKIAEEKTSKENKQIYALSQEKIQELKKKIFG